MSNVTNIKIRVRVVLNTGHIVGGVGRDNLRCSARWREGYKRSAAMHFPAVSLARATSGCSAAQRREADVLAQACRTTGSFFLDALCLYRVYLYAPCSSLYLSSTPRLK